MVLNCSFRTAASTRRHPLKCRYSAACAILAASGFLVLPARAQTCTPPAGALGTPTYSNKDFYTNFASTPALLQQYGILLNPASGSNAAGDRNSTYFPLYYSIANLNTWMTNNPNSNCQVELVIVGNFPDTRYFSVTDNDEHYTATQHLADADIDPAEARSGASGNPFVPTQIYNGSQPYVAPVSLGYVPPYPAGTPGCGIQPYEEDNLLDATQRHLFNDWNTNVRSPGVATGELNAHFLDAPNHSPLYNSSNQLIAGPNTAGSIVVRGYLPPYSCSGSPGSPTGSLNCFQSVPVAAPYLFVRDVQSGCPYTATWLTSNSWTPSPGAPQQPMVYNFVRSPGNNPVNCVQDPSLAGCDAIASTADLSGSPTSPASNWLSKVQQQQHTNDANLVPQACYANGDATQFNPWGEIGQSLDNRVPWARGPQWDGTPGPDDTYIGGAVSTTDLAGLSMQNGYTAPCLNGDYYPSSDGCLIRFRFQIPAMPQTPCSGCSLTGNEALRYMSLTFWQQQPSTGMSYIADPDGIDAPSGTTPVSIVSLADSAFCTSTPCYATLLVNVGALPTWLAPPGVQGSSATGVVQGVSPGNNSNGNYSVWTTSGGYTVLDLTQFTGPTNAFSLSYPLLMVIRNVLPNTSPTNPFNCSGSAVPFATSVYTNVDGAGATLMGPYVPLVDYVDGSNTSMTGLPPQVQDQQIQLADPAKCGALPSGAFPGQNAPTTSVPLDWPNQSWPNLPSPASPNLVCPSLLPPPNPPAIDFVATQFPTPVNTSSVATNCGHTPNNCTQVILQKPQTTEKAAGSTWQPPLPVTIVGSGFGFLPNLPQLMASCASPSNCPNLLEIYDDNASAAHTSTWDTSSGADCQVYIANWTDTSISLVVNLQTQLQNGYEGLYQLGPPPVYLSPLSDISPWAFPAVAPSSSTGCPVAYQDHLKFTITNPQTTTNPQPSQVSKTITVSPATASPK